MKRTLLQVLTGRGNDGLTKREREALAEAYREHAMRTPTKAEMEAFLAWRERRL
jgi:hypothetical protein